MNQINPEFEQHQSTPQNEWVDDAHGQVEDLGEAPSHLDMHYGVEIDEAVGRILSLHPEGRGMRVSKLMRTSLQGLLHQQQDISDFKEAAAAHPNIVQSTEKLFRVVPASATEAEVERKQPRTGGNKKSLDGMLAEWKKNAPQEGGKGRSRKGGGHKRRTKM